MSRTASAWTLALIFLVLAGATRFYRLDWSYGPDEVASMLEAESLAKKPYFLSGPGIIDRLPRANPLPYLAQIASIRLFGQTEFGARAAFAAAGTLSIGAAVLLTGLLFGRLTAIYVGIITLLWPWHLFYSQYDRMYGIAFLFGTTAILAATLSWQRNSLAWAVLSAVLSALAVSSHNLAIFVPACLGLCAVCAGLFARDRLPLRAVWGYALAGIPLIGVSAFLGWLHMRGWGGMEIPFFTDTQVLVGTADASTSGRLAYAVTNVIGLASNLTLAVSFLSLAGFLMSFKSAWRMLRPFSVLAAAAVLQCVLVPFLAPHRIAYVFPISIAFVVLAASVFALVHEKLREQARFLPPMVVAVILMPTLLHLISYYQDGDRHDYRAAAEYVSEHKQEGDLVTADRNSILGHYLGEQVIAVKRPESRPRECVAKLEEVRRHGQRIWYVCRFDTGEPPPETDQWLWTHAVRMRRFRKRRLDYRENIVDVYLLPAPSSPKKDDGTGPVDEPGAALPQEIPLQPVTIRRLHS